MNAVELCRRCNGTGIVPGPRNPHRYRPCPDCDGRGVRRRETTR